MLSLAKEGGGKSLGGNHVETETDSTDAIAAKICIQATPVWSSSHRTPKITLNRPGRREDIRKFHIGSKMFEPHYSVLE